MVTHGQGLKYTKITIQKMNSYYKAGYRMDKATLLARIRRQNIANNQKETYLGAREIVQKINLTSLREDGQILFGLFQSEQSWIVLSVNMIYWKNGQIVGSVDIQKDGQCVEILNGPGQDKGNGHLTYKRSEEIWTPNLAAACSILNVVLLLEKLEAGVVLPA